MKKVILVQRIDPNFDKIRANKQLEELKNLAHAAGYEVIQKMIQTRNPDKKYQIGKGKVEELTKIVNLFGISKIIFYNGLSSMQMYNLVDKCKCEVIDKFQLILEIFALRATTRRSQLQVELARLEYEIPRAKTIISHLKKEERQGFMSMGNYEDSYEQDIKGRIARIKNELNNFQINNSHLRTIRDKRGFAQITLAGYTNAGKSTLFNTLMSQSVEVADMLFTTLSPINRVLNIKGRKVIVTDTVGFIEDLPHWLIDAFKSTLNEIFYADIILLVVDASDSTKTMYNKLLACHTTLWEQTSDVTIITAMNKVDLVEHNVLSEKMNELNYLIPNPVFISASTGYGVSNLKEVIREHLPIWKHKKFLLPLNEKSMSLISWLHNESIIHSISYGKNIEISIEARDEIINKLENIQKI